MYDSSLLNISGGRQLGTMGFISALEVDPTLGSWGFRLVLQSSVRILRGERVNFFFLSFSRVVGICFEHLTAKSPL